MEYLGSQQTSSPCQSCDKEFNCSCGDLQGIGVTFLIVIMLIVIWFCFLKVVSRQSGRSTEELDVLNIKLFEAPFLNGSDQPLENCCSTWPISHFILFFILGILFPNCDAVVIGAGIVWEGIETVGGYLTGRVQNGTYQARRTSEGDLEYSNWIAGSLKDILMDIAGFYVGKFIAVAFNVNIDWDKILSPDKTKDEDAPEDNKSS